MALASLTFYSIVLFLHVTAVVVAFGVIFTYPLIVPLTERLHTRNLPYLLRMQSAIGQRVITPAATVILAAGLYMALRGPFDLSDWWVGIGLLVVITLLGAGHAFFGPTEERLAEIAERDIAKAGDGEVALSPEYRALARRLALGGAGANVLVLVAIFVMIMGSRGYL